LRRNASIGDNTEECMVCSTRGSHFNARIVHASSESDRICLVFIK
jgi:hypothetical protein